MVGGLLVTFRTGLFSAYLEVNLRQLTIATLQWRLAITAQMEQFVAALRRLQLDGGAEIYIYISVSYTHLTLPTKRIV